MSFLLPWMLVNNDIITVLIITIIINDISVVHGFSLHVSNNREIIISHHHHPRSRDNTSTSTSTSTSKRRRSRRSYEKDHPTKQNQLQNQQQYIINPKTNRKIKVGGPTYYKNFIQGDDGTSWVQYNGTFCKLDLNMLGEYQYQQQSNKNNNNNIIISNKNDNDDHNDDSLFLIEKQQKQKQQKEQDDDNTTNTNNNKHHSDAWYCIVPSVVVDDDDDKEEEEEGDDVELNYDTTTTTTTSNHGLRRRSLTPEELSLLNNQLLFIYKPSGMNCVPPRNISEDNNSDLSTQVKQVFGNNCPDIKPCHRLDRDTSGIVVFALTKTSHRNISKQFENRSTYKTYLALIAGHPSSSSSTSSSSSSSSSTSSSGGGGGDNNSGIIDLPIGKIQTKEGYNRWTIGGNKPRQAITQYKILDKRRHEYCYYYLDDENNNRSRRRIVVVASAAKFTKIELIPKTGRGHQLRLHMKFGLNCPILGDTIHAVGGSTTTTTTISSSSSSCCCDDDDDIIDDDDNCNAIGLCSPRLCLHAWKIQVDWNGLRLEATSVEPF